MSDVDTRSRRSGSQPMTDDYETAEPEGGRLLWGRLAVAGLALLLTFVLGRSSVNEGVPRTEFDQVSQRVQDLQEQNTLLSAELAASNAGTATEETTGTAAAEGTDASDGDTAPAQPSQEAPQQDGQGSASSGQTYVVEPGDTLGGIAAALYGDSSKFDLIAEANGIDSATELAVGTELRIPPDPDED